MFTIQHASGTYFHNKGRIILYESEQEAVNYLNAFINYAMNRLAQEGRVGEVMRVPMFASHECRILPVTFDINEVECGTVWAKDLAEEERNE